MLVELLVVFACCLSLLSILFSIVACAVAGRLEKEMKILKHQVCENLTTDIPQIIRQEVSRSLH